MVQWLYMKERIKSWFVKKADRSSSTPRSEKVIRATNETLDKYSKTFKDLARYDRREKVLR